MQEVQRLLEARPELLDAPGERRWQPRPLIEAIQWRRREIVRWVLDKGADLEARHEGLTPYLWSAFTGDAEILQLLLARGAQPGAKDDRGHTALHIAAARGWTECVRRLVEHGADSLASDVRGRTPWHAAAAGGYWDVLGALRASLRDASGLPVDRYGWTPLHLVAAHGHHPTSRDGYINLIALARQEGRKYPLDTATVSGKTALHFAARHGDLRLAELLLANGTDAKKPDARGWAAHDFLRRGDHARLKSILTNDPASHPRPPAYSPSAALERRQAGAPLIQIEHLRSMSAAGSDDRARGGSEVTVWPHGEVIASNEPRTWWTGYHQLRLGDAELKALLVEIEETGILDVPGLNLTGPDTGGTRMTINIGGRTIAHQWSEGGSFGIRNVSEIEAQQAWLLVRRRLLDLWLKD